MKNLVVVAAFIALSACTHVDTGQVDYRVADPPATAPQQNRDRTRCETAERCDPLLPVRVDRRYLPDTSEHGRPFAAREVYSIDIDQGMIGTNLLEGHIFGRQFGHVGEFAILANVFEFASSAGEAQQRRFLESGEYSTDTADPSDVELKLIYYSDDVRRAQPFSFSRIPLIPRTSYNGGSIGIQIVIIETDVRSGPLGSLLTTLARFGQQAVPGPSEATDLLFDLGESLFSGTTGSDDRLFEYRFVLSAPTGEPGAVNAMFAPGRYVLRRAQNRSEPINWNNVRLDHNTGRLFNLQGTELRDELYLVLNVSRYPEGTSPEFYTQREWPEFRQILQQAADTEDAPLNAVTSNLQQVVANHRSEQWGNRLLGRWSQIERHLRIYTASTVTNVAQIDLARCPSAVSTLARAQQLSARAIRDGTREFLADYGAATRVTDGTPNGEFDPSNREALISRIARYFMPWATPELEAKFSDATHFSEAFGANPDALTDAAMAAARTQGRTASGCDDILNGVPPL